MKSDSDQDDTAIKKEKKEHLKRIGDSNVENRLHCIHKLHGIKIVEYHCSVKSSFDRF